ncbi:hypothetical protein CDAR_464851 [Caerostris darwini]|uniref:Uncharacterized protein n=1 Tax=Caerostris darwini TaxID=1538125 RepID=A0AAV4QK05_9ARAC|nr:hypothetical protein CDAR_464851 [Caerostris darwini]
MSTENSFRFFRISCQHVPSSIIQSTGSPSSHYKFIRFGRGCLNSLRFALKERHNRLFGVSSLHLLSVQSRDVHQHALFTTSERSS